MQRNILTNYPVVQEATDIEWVNGEQIIDDLLCGICFDVLDDPQSTLCDQHQPDTGNHTFCRSCLEKHLQTRTKCPICNMNVVSYRASDAIIRRMINALPKRCGDCNATGNRQEMNAHLRSCAAETLGCTVKLCPTRIVQHQNNCLFFNQREVLVGIHDYINQATATVQIEFNRQIHQHYETILQQTTTINQQQVSLDQLRVQLTEAVAELNQLKSFKQDQASQNDVRTLCGHTNGVSSITQLADGRIASASHDNSIKIWDISSGQCVKTLCGHTIGVTSIIELAGDRIASASHDKSIKIWDISS
ncbi:hypothetical protein AKO1_006647, partial [Acrasis kona]